MRPDIHWIDLPVVGRLAIMARPRAGDWLDDEIAGWRAAGIDIVVSLLEPTEIAELGLDREPALCREHGMELISFPVADRGVPSSPSEAAALARRLAAAIAAGKAVAIHCRAGIGRSSMIAACVMVLAGTEPSAALDLIAAARGTRVPDTDEQRAWLAAFATDSAR
jgi:protein-tyrosine phosphatase